MANPTTDRLLRLLAYFENGAASIRATLDFLQHDPTGRAYGRNGNGNGHDLMPGPLQGAVLLDQARRARYIKHGRRTGPQTNKKISAQRQRTADLLAGLNPTTPTLTAEMDPVARRGIGSMVRRGYVKRKGDGYVRTAKAFDVDPKSATGQA